MAMQPVFSPPTPPSSCRVVRLFWQWLYDKRRWPFFIAGRVTTSQEAYICNVYICKEGKFFLVTWLQFHEGSCGGSGGTAWHIHGIRQCQGWYLADLGGEWRTDAYRSTFLVTMLQAMPILQFWRTQQTAINVKEAVCSRAAKSRTVLQWA